MQPPVPEHPAAVLGTQIRAPLSPRASNMPGAGRAGSPLLSLPAPSKRTASLLSAGSDHLARSRHSQLPQHPLCPRLCLGKPLVLIEMLTPLPRSPRRLAAALTDGRGAGLPALSSPPALAASTDAAPAPPPFLLAGSDEPWPASEMLRAARAERCSSPPLCQLGFPGRKLVIYSRPGCWQHVATAHGFASPTMHPQRLRSHPAASGTPGSSLLISPPSTPKGA